MDSCASRHLTNDKELFVGDLKAKSLDFTTASGQTLRAESIGTIVIPLANGTSIKLEGVAYAPECDANLISLGKLRENNIMFVDNEDNMTLMQGGQEIARARRDRNLFVLDLATPNRAMQTLSSGKAMTAQGRGRPTHLVSRNKRFRVWHRRMGHASNARIIRASKLLIGMGDFNAEYNPAEVYSDSEQSDSDNDTDNTKEVPRQYETPKTN